tara:strand:+ start:3960 stop:4574 length:615 start_codon:yes stop_codon:yes gene_type:complete
MEITLIKDAQKVKHQIPTDWEDVSLRQYVEVIKKAKEVGLRELEKVVQIISILTKIKEEDLMRLPSKNIAVLGGFISELIQSLPEDELRHFITIDDVEYGFHPKLEDITMGEWVDIDTYISNGVDDNLHKIMSVLYRPVIAKDSDDKYAIEDYKPDKKRQELFRDNLNVGDFYGVSVFFSELGSQLLMNTLSSSLKGLKNKQKE